jgi:RimJ/RimL family protein N-acetyltransferase
MINSNLGPIVLEGEYVRLEPLRMEHSEAVWEAAQKLDWSWFLDPLRSKEAVERRIERGLKGEENNQEFAFAVVSRRESQVIGSTSFLSVVQLHRRAEIGSTWYVPSQQGTAVNPECKFLLLGHAFENWGAVRIELRTDENNLHSQRAIAKLGAKFEGVMRNNGIRPDGSFRNAMLYSIIPSEWPEVKSKLLGRVASFRE